MYWPDHTTIVVLTFLAFLILAPAVVLGIFAFSERFAVQRKRGRRRRRRLNVRAIR